jgi:gamma-glutamyl-gamma-aminobutyrate hydrolase PuuD
LVGVTAYRQETTWWSWDRDAALVPGAYLDVVVAAGGWPVLVPPLGDGAVDDPAGAVAAVAGPLVDTVDALVVIGGGDVSAERYDEAPDPRNGGTNEYRDELEFRLLEAALDRDLPVLAVCRGMQVLNVLLGGTLVQQLPDVLGTTCHQPAPGAFGEVTVHTEPSTIARRLLGDGTAVCCSHHQAVDAVGESLLVSARSDDGVIEAVEVLGRTFVVGVQWHPEETGDRRLFVGLVEAARAVQARRAGS